ncbi:hypothetical protein [Rhodococcus erythropolis]|uniref:hypothetical protein n=1 Tax=Rhodococcus erythropolis TaxID=1833 RepID=UPI003671D336
MIERPKRKHSTNSDISEIDDLVSFSFRRNDFRTHANSVRRFADNFELPDDCTNTFQPPLQPASLGMFNLRDCSKSHTAHIGASRLGDDVTATPPATTSTYVPSSFVSFSPGPNTDIN